MILPKSFWYADLKNKCNWNENLLQYCVSLLSLVINLMYLLKYQYSFILKNITNPKL